MGIAELVAEAYSDPKALNAPPAHGEREPPHDYQSAVGEKWVDPEIQEVEGLCRQVLEECVNEKGLQHFYPIGGTRLGKLASNGPEIVRKLMGTWHIPRKYAIDITVSQLYDWVLFIDDSGSMQQGRDRIDLVEVTLNHLAVVAKLCDDDGFKVRAFTTDLSHLRKRDGRLLQDHCENESDVQEIIRAIQFKYATPVGTESQKKIHQPMILDPVRKNTLEKPVLVFTLTDGKPEPEPEGTMEIVCNTTYGMLRNTQYGMGALINMWTLLAPVPSAVRFGLRLDNNDTWGENFDILCPLESWLTMMRSKHPDGCWDFFTWLTKLICGPHLKRWDAEDPTDDEIRRYFA